MSSEFRYTVTPFGLDRFRIHLGGGMGDISLFPNREQLRQLQRDIETALGDGRKMNRKMRRAGHGLKTE